MLSKSSSCEFNQGPKKSFSDENKAAILIEGALFPRYYKRCDETSKQFCGFN